MAVAQDDERGRAVALLYIRVQRDTVRPLRRILKEPTE